MAASKFHPALAVTNIKNNIPIILEMETDHYSAWAELFKLHARSHRVLSHILPTRKEQAPSSDEEKEMWSTLDATVLQWVYATISTDLLHTIIAEDLTANEAWDRLRDLFQDNKNSCVVTLEHNFSHVKMRDFPSASAYCQRSKTMADQLKSVGAPVTDNRLVLQLVTGLTDAYKNVGTLLRQSKPLPSFSEARLSLCLEEKALAEMTDDAPTAMVATTPQDFDDSSSSHGQAHQSRNNNSINKNGNKKKTGGGGRGSGRGGGNRRGGGGRSSGHSLRPRVQQQWPPTVAPWQWGWMPQRAPPPCPFPTSQWACPTSGPNRGMSLLGSWDLSLLKHMQQPSQFLLMFPLMLRMLSTL
ncbi:uncharacterized protein LOC125494659 [Beta vulgaris subsp. vulgaris]|uniref:uncharacterized protein LOC125494659 n=1 Tax=Beta vulgaris subsp. vulgaris TaxID=3555 RepID=UPI002036C512|nr:uncharacterized protein LOC125494659 [Beta vulgaris subsp. vulgaris]